MSQSNERARTRATASERVINRDINTYRMNDKHLAVKSMLAVDIFFGDREFLRIWKWIPWCSVCFELGLQLKWKISYPHVFIVYYEHAFNSG